MGTMIYTNGIHIHIESDACLYTILITITIYTYLTQWVICIMPVGYIIYANGYIFHVGAYLIAIYTQYRRRHTMALLHGTHGGD